MFSNSFIGKMVCNCTINIGLTLHFKQASYQFLIMCYKRSKERVANYTCRFIFMIGNGKILRIILSHLVHTNTHTESEKCTITSHVQTLELKMYHQRSRSVTSYLKVSLIVNFWRPALCSQPDLVFKNACCATNTSSQDYSHVLQPCTVYYILCII